MKVLEERNAFLSDYEVLKFLTDLEKNIFGTKKFGCAEEKSLER